MFFWDLDIKDASFMHEEYHDVSLNILRHSTYYNHLNYMLY